MNYLKGLVVQAYAEKRKETEEFHINHYDLTKVWRKKVTINLSIVDELNFNRNPENLLFRCRSKAALHPSNLVPRYIPRLQSHPGPGVCCKLELY